MKTRRKTTKPKRGQSAAAPAAEGEGARARKSPLGLVDADSIHELMELNGPKVTRWAFACVEKVARGRASLLEQKIALAMIQKCTPSTGRKGEEPPEDIPEGATKEELRALNALIEEQKGRQGGLAPAREGAHARIERTDAGYQVREPKVE